MPRKVRVLTTSFGNAATRTIDDNRELAASFVGLAGAEGADRLAATTLDLEKKVFHIDGQVDKILRLQQERGAAVDVRAYSQENVFTLQSNDQEWPVSRLEEAYGLEDFTSYHLRSTGVQDRLRDAARKPDAAHAG